MKKSTFITITLLCTLLTGCGSRNSQSVLTTQEFYAECEIDREEIKNLSDKLDVIIANQTSLAENMQEQKSADTNTTQEVPDTKDEQEVPAPTASPTVQTNSTISLSILYNNELLAVPLSTDSKFTPFELTYPGHADRDLNVIISGTISNVNLVDEKGNYVSSISFEEINNLYYFYFYMDNNGTNGAKFYFEIITTGNKHYYFGVDYH